MCVARRAADAADAFGVIVLQFWSIALSKVGSLLYRFVGYESNLLISSITQAGIALFVPRIQDLLELRILERHVVSSSCRRRLLCCCADVIPKTCVGIPTAAAVRALARCAWPHNERDLLVSNVRVYRYHKLVQLDLLSAVNCCK